MRAFLRFHRHLGAEELGPRARRAVRRAFAGDLATAAAKTVAAFATGSASMLAEAVHSWVDITAEVFLVNAYRSARRAPDESHPLGYGRESYVWSLFASIGIFVVGAEVGVWRGIAQFGSAGPAPDYRLGYAVLAVSFALEAWSFARALGFLRERAFEIERGVLEHWFNTSDSQLRSVVAEDFTALVGLVIAGLGMLLHQLTGRVAFDAAGSIAIGALMGAAGLVLIKLNSRFLSGMPISPVQRWAAVRELSALPEVARVTSFFAEFIGPGRLIVAARVGLAGEHSQAELGRLLRALEQRMMENPYVGRAILTLAAPDEPALAPPDAPRPRAGFERARDS